MNHLREMFAAAVGVIGGAVTTLYGGWNGAMTTLLIFMGADILTGLIVAGVFKASGKTETGALESKAGWKGLCRKGVTLLIVLMGARIDLVLGVNYVKDAVVIGFLVNEAISILENAGLMGIKYPDAITNALELLRKKEDTTHEDR